MNNKNPQKAFDMRSCIKSSILSGSLMLLSGYSFAAEPAAQALAPAEKASSFNPVLIALLAVIIVLFFAILVLGGVLSQLGGVYREKMRQARVAGSGARALLVLLTLSLVPASAIAQETETATELSNVSQPEVIAGLQAQHFYLLMGTIALELLVLTALLFTLRVLLRAISNRPERVSKTSSLLSSISFWDKVNAVVPLEKEEEIMLDHEYDGIRELDNSLPPWWKYGFYLTIVVAGVYLWYYHGGGNGPSSEQEYIAAVEKGEADKAAYLAKNAGNIDESNVKMADVAGIEEGKTIYAKNCAACHAPDGGGSVGPNLADPYWLHGGSLADVFKSIKYGWQDKGMKSWKDDFSPRQLAHLASYVKSLEGTKPAAPKEKQGELYVEGGAAPAADSTAANEAGKAIAVQ